MGPLNMNNKNFVETIKVICIVFALSFASFLTAQNEDEYTINFVGDELELFIKTVGEVTGKNFIIYDQTVKTKKIYLVSSKPVSKELLYKIFLSVMEYNGYILETVGSGENEIIKIKRNIQGPWTPTVTIFDESELKKYEEKDFFITMVIKLKYISAREVQTTLRALRIVNPQGGNLAGIEGSNTILITDFAPNVKRIYDVIQIMDRPGPEKELRIFKMQYADATSLVDTLNELTEKQTRSSGIGLGPNLDDVKIVADPRLGALIVQAYPGRMERLARIIEELDQQLNQEPSNFHYIRLKHADASVLQETLAKLVEDGGFSGQSGARPAGSKVSSGGRDEDAKPAIETDTQNNALIVKASPREWNEILSIIRQVDVRRPQVQIEAAIVEVSPQDILGLGIELFFAENAEDGQATLGGGTNFGFTNLVAVNNNTAVPINGNQAITAQKFGKLPALPFRDPFQRSGTFFANYDDLFTLPILLNAIQTQIDTKVVALPSIVTNDNQQAQLKVADAQPSVVNNVDDAGGVRETFGDFQEAGTTLLVTPHISGEKNYLRLDLSQTIEAFDRASAAVGGVQAKTSRQIVTSVTIPDGHTVAIGGLTFDSRTISVEKVPLLGDLPLIGFLFQTRIVTHNKQNIYLFVTPRILRDENFQDFKKFSHEVKVETSKFGVDMNLIDPSFARYQQKYGLSDEEPEPLYMLEYQSPNSNR